MDTSSAAQCLRCSTAMVSAGVHEIHEGPLFGVEPLMPIVLRLGLVVCPACGHVEFFVPGVREDASADNPLQPRSPQSIVADRPSVVNEEGRMEEIWMCSCGEVNFASDDECLGCGLPKP